MSNLNYHSSAIKPRLISFVVTFLLVSCAHAVQQTPKLSDFEPESYKKQEKYKTVQVLAVGEGAERAYAFFPVDQSPRQLPLVIFLHGWLGTNPKNFGALIDHLVRRGSVVIYPVYQVDAHTAPQSITDKAAHGISQVLSKLNLEQPHLIDLQKTLYYGFSMGASMSINLVTNPDKYKMPTAQAMILAAPGDAKHVAHGDLATSIVNTPITKVPLSIPIVLLSGQEDRTIGMPTAIAYWNEICPQGRQQTLITWPPGKTAQESIASGHGAPGAPDDRYDFPNIFEPISLATIEQIENFPESKSINNLDFYGQWKIVTGFLDALKSGHSPTWIFNEKRLISNLGKFKNGESYPAATIEGSCPAALTDPTGSSKTKTAPKAVQRPK